MLAFLFGFAAIKAEEIPNGIMPHKRQVVGTGATTSTTPSTTTPSTTSTSNSPTTSTTPAQTSTSTSTSTHSSDTTTSIPVTTSNSDGTQTTSHVSTSDITSTKAVQTTKGTDNSVVKVGSTTIDPKTLSAKTTVREPLVTKATKHLTLTSTWTSNGQVYSSVYTTKDVFASTTGYATATIAPSLANSGGNGSNLSTNTKKVVGGVVGGIGGAVLVAGLAFVAWRLWGKKKNDAQDMQQQDMYSNDSLRAQKRASGNTLDTYSEPYWNPNGAVNTASNF